MATESKIKEDSVAVPVAQGDLDAVSNGTFYNPHEVLGGHLGPDEHEDVVTIRVLRPLAKSVTIITENARTQAVHEHNGVFMALIPAIKTDDGFDVPDYRISTEYEDGSTVVSDDRDRYRPPSAIWTCTCLARDAMSAFGRLWERACCAMTIRWAPMTASRANSWWAPHSPCGLRMPMRYVWWEISTAGTDAPTPCVNWAPLESGSYSFLVSKRERFTSMRSSNANNEWVMKADPMERSHEIPPRTGSIVVDSVHAWHDENWMDQRAKTDPHNGPVSIYEVHASSWRKDVKNYRRTGRQAGPLRPEGRFHPVEFMPLAEHPSPARGVIR